MKNNIAFFRYCLMGATWLSFAANAVSYYDGDTIVIHGYPFVYYDTFLISSSISDAYASDKYHAQQTAIEQTARMCEAAPQIQSGAVRAYDECTDKETDAYTQDKNSCDNSATWGFTKADGGTFIWSSGMSKLDCRKLMKDDHDDRQKNICQAKYDHALAGANGACIAAGKPAPFPN